jgi:hypothetical protein
MWIIGFVALVQMTILPGLLLIRAIEPRSLNAAERMAYVFALSLIANAVMVPVLVTCGIYNAPVLWVLLLVETWFVLRTRSGPEARTIDLRTLDRVRDLRFTTALGGLLLFAALLIYVRLFAGNWGSIFNANDDVANWNRWAKQWATSVYPTVAALYPQLLPANWSLTYVLLGTTEVQLFAKGTTVFYGALVLLLFVSLAVRRRSDAHLFGGWIFGMLTFHYLGFEFLGWGYAELPLAFFSFLAFYAGYRSAAGPERIDILLALIFAFGALITKQGAIYVVVVAIVWAAWQWRTRRDGAGFFRIDAAVLTLGVTVAFAAAWYAAKFIQIYFGRDVSNLRHLTQELHGGRGYAERLVHIATMFWQWRGTPGHFAAAAVATLLVAGLFMRESRRIALLLLFPFLLLYGMFFSYEVRVSAPAFPLVALVCGFPAERAARLGAFLDRRRIAGWRAGSLLVLLSAIMAAAWVYTEKPGLAALPLSLQTALAEPATAQVVEWFAYCLFAAAAPVLFCVLCVRIESGRLDLRAAVLTAVAGFVVYGALANPGSRLLAQQRDLVRRIGNPTVNEKLYAAVRERSITSGILSDYWFLRDLPDINQLFRPVRCSLSCTPDALRAAAVAYGDVGYILIHEFRLAPETKALVSRNTEYVTVFTDPTGMLFLQINPASPAMAQNRPVFTRVTPAAGAGHGALFTFVFTDPQGSSDIASVIALVNSRIDGAHACYVEWIRKTNSLLLAADGGVGWAGESAPGAAAVIRNSQCEVDASGVRVSESGKQLEFTVPLRFSPSFAGEQRLYAAGTDSVARAPYRDLGAWAVP